MATRKRCKGTNRRGEQCGKWISGEADYCTWHELPENERVSVEKFFSENAKSIAAFIAGGFAEAFIGDIYGLIKENLLGTWAAPSLRMGEKENLLTLSRKFNQNRDLESFGSLLSSLQFVEGEKDIRGLLGKPNQIKSDYVGGVDVYGNLMDLEFTYNLKSPTGEVLCLDIWFYSIESNGKLASIEIRRKTGLEPI